MRPCWPRACNRLRDTAASGGRGFFCRHLLLGTAGEPSGALVVVAKREAALLWQRERDGIILAQPLTDLGDLAVERHGETGLIAPQRAQMALRQPHQDGEGRDGRGSRAPIEAIDDIRPNAITSADCGSGPPVSAARSRSGTRCCSRLVSFPSPARPRTIRCRPGGSARRPRSTSTLPLSSFWSM